MEKDSINDSIIFLKCANYEKPLCNPKLMDLVAWGLADNGKEEEEEEEEEEESVLNTDQLNKICNECKHFKTKL